MEFKKSDLIEQRYKNAPSLKKKQVLKVLIKFLENMKDFEYLFFFSRSQGFYQVFERVDGVSIEDEAEVLYKYFEETSYYDSEKDTNISLTDIVDIYEDPMQNVLNIYIKGKEFLLIEFNGIVEKLEVK